MYDERFAQAAENQYDGITNGQQWRRNTLNYLVGHCPDAEKLLMWAEAQQGHTVTIDMMNNAGPMLQMTLPPAVVARHVWTFLSLNLTKDAKVKFNNVERLNGADAWRKITMDISSKTESRRLVLMRKINNPGAVAKLTDAMMHVERWEQDHADYVECGGTSFTDEQRKGILMSIIPEQAANQLIWKIGEFRTYGALREHLRTTIDMIQMGSGKPTHLLEEGAKACPQLGDAQAFSLDEIPPGAAPEEVLALYNKWQNRRQGGPRTGPTRPKSDMSCINCGKKGHAAAECRSAPVDKANRPCFVCGKKGHIAKNCDKNIPAKRLEPEEEEAFCLQTEGAWERVQRGTPMRAATTKPQLKAGGGLVGSPSRGRYQALEDARNREEVAMTMVDEAIKEIEREERNDPRQRCGVCCAEANLLEADSMVAAIEEEEVREVYIEVALDSGSGEHVADPDDAPGYALEPSPGSRMGQNFVGAGGERIPNEGEMQLNLEVPNGTERTTPLRSTFQGAKVTRPLHSVSKICDEGFEVRFKKGAATILNANGKLVARYERKGGLYVATMRLKPPSPKKALPESFRRQGA